MGFLDRLVGGMLKESVGYDVGKITRMIGGKNLLMLGAGAALAGGAASGFGQGESDGPSTWQDPPRQGAAPPLPPVPGAPAGPSAAPTSLPPVPSIPTAVATPASDLSSPDLPSPDLPPVPSAPPAVQSEPAPEPVISPQLTYALVRCMVSAALADGHLDDKEKAMILGHLEESNLDAEQRQQVHRDLVIPPSPADLAALSDSFDEREAMYRFAALVILTDDDISEFEREWLDRLAVSFAFDGERQLRLEDEVRSG